MSIESVARKLENIYAEDGPADKAHFSLGNAEEAITSARDTLLQASQGSAQPELAESVRLHAVALEKIDEAREAMGRAVMGVIAVRGRVLGEGFDTQPTAAASQASAEQTSDQSPLQPKKAPRLAVRVVHRTAKGVHLNKHPDPDMQADVQRLIETRALEEELFRDFVDTAPNLNDEYAEEIALVRQYFADQGIAIAPIVTLDQEHFERAAQLRGIDSASSNGYLSAGRIVMRPVADGVIKEIFGNHTFIGTLIHEGEHSERTDKEDLFIVSAQQGNNASTVVDINSGGFIRNGISTNNLGQAEISSEGHFFNEGVADLKRVEGLRALGRESDIDGTLVLNEGRTYVGKNETAALPSVDNPTIEIPARFAKAARSMPDGQNAVIQSVPMLASYGLELIANAVPGFRTALDQSRHNPTMQAEVIKAVNSLQPGLYRNLRKLPYTNEGFEQGLRLIGQAIRDKE